MFIRIYLSIVKQPLLDSVRVEVLVAVTGMSILFWDMMPCNLVKVSRYSRGTYSHHHQGQELAKHYFYHKRWCHIPEESILKV
jgi:hypothetical protein